MINHTSRPVTESFSAGYELVCSADVHMYSSEEAVMDVEMMRALEARFTPPLIGRVGNLHYQFKPEKGVPSDSVAVPRDNHDDPTALLIQK
jgi:hypothetical protein